MDLSSAILSMLSRARNPAMPDLSALGGSLGGPFDSTMTVPASPSLPPVIPGLPPALGSPMPNPMPMGDGLPMPDATIDVPASDPVGRHAGARFGNIIQQVAPFILAAIAARKGGPQSAGAMLNGFAVAAARKRQEDDAAAERDAQAQATEQDRQIRREQYKQTQAQERAKWVMSAEGEVAKIEDPIQAAALAKKYDEITGKVYGTPEGTITVTPRDPSKRAAADAVSLRTEAQAALDRVKALHGDQFGELVSSGATVDFRGKPVSLRDLQAMTGTAVSTPTGEPVGLPKPVKKDETTTEEERYRRDVVFPAYADKIHKPVESLTAADRRAAVLDYEKQLGTARRVPVPTGQETAGVPAGGYDVPEGGGRNEAFLKSLPASQATVVKMLADGRKAFPTGAALRSEYWQNMLNLVARYDPGYDEINYTSRLAVRRDFTSGKSADQVRALNTVIGHMAQLSEAADALNNKNWSTYNKIANALATEFGWTGKTDFDTIAPKVAQELTRVWRGTGGSEADIERDISAISDSNAPAQLHSSINKMSGLIESQLDSMKDRYRQGMGIADIEMIRPESRAALDRMESKAGGGGTAATKTIDGFTFEQQGDGTWKIPGGTKVYQLQADGTMKRIR